MLKILCSSNRTRFTLQRYELDAFNPFINCLYWPQAINRSFMLLQAVFIVNPNSDTGKMMLYVIKCIYYEMCRGEVGIRRSENK